MEGNRESNPFLGALQDHHITLSLQTFWHASRNLFLTKSIAHLMMYESNIAGDTAGEEMKG